MGSQGEMKHWRWVGFSHLEVEGQPWSAVRAGQRGTGVELSSVKDLGGRTQPCTASEDQENRARGVGPRTRLLIKKKKT